MTGNPEVVPTALLHNIEHNQVLHEQVVLMTVRTAGHPATSRRTQRIEVEALGAGLLPGRRELRLHGPARRPAGAGAVPGARPAGRPDADLVLHRPRDADPDAAPADGAGRGARVHVRCPRAACRPPPTSGSRRSGWWSWAPSSRSEGGPGSVRPAGAAATGVATMTILSGQGRRRLLAVGVLLGLGLWLEGWIGVLLLAAAADLAVVQAALQRAADLLAGAGRHRCRVAARRPSPRLRLRLAGGGRWRSCLGQDLDLAVLQNNSSLDRPD